MNRKQGIALLLAVCMLIGMPVFVEQVLATSATEKKEELEDNLDDVNSEMDDIKDSQDELEDQIATTRNKLVKLLSQMDELETEIHNIQFAVEQTELELEKARADEQEQYEAMLIRIQYMYENSTQDSLLEAIIGARSLADLLKRVEYVAAVQKADRELTEEYKQTVKEVEDKQATLLVQLDELMMKQETFLGQQAEIEGMLASLGDLQEEYANQLALAQQKAADYQNQIAIQEEIMRKEEEERKRLEEERKKREEEEKKKQEEANKNNNNNNNTGTTVPGNSKGEEIVAYALQFVGNPYVWGGNSLTNGCDCSGFVHLIYEHFGYSVPRYSMSFLYVGEPVDREDIQPGDIVVYERKNGVGHVAIYIGDGKIVEAQSTATGITAYRSVDNRRIVGIRRVVD